MNTPEKKCLGYLKYYGESVEQGLLDARKSADALVGFDEALRYLIGKEDPVLRNIDFEFPVQIQQGSWEIVVPENIETLLRIAGGTTLLTVYLGTLAAKAANDGILESGPIKDLKKIIRGAIKALRWLVEIAKYCGKFGSNNHENVKVIDNEFVEIYMAEAPPLRVPYKYFKLYTEAPASLLSKASSVIEKNREMEIGVHEESGLVRTQITVHEKAIFCKEKEEIDEIILPELVDGEFVALDGVVTRCNEPLNNVGFEYRGHTLTCKPVSGNVVDFKKKFISKNDNHVYAPVKLEGRVDRKDIQGEFKEKYPRIFFSNITPRESVESSPELFPKE